MTMQTQNISGGVNGFFVLSFEDNTVRTGYFLLKKEIKDCNVMIDGIMFFDQSVKNYLRT